MKKHFFCNRDFGFSTYSRKLTAYLGEYFKRFIPHKLGERQETRRLRQQDGETFIMWADEYYSDHSKFGTRIGRKILYDQYLDYSPEQRKFCSPTIFKKKFVNYCALKGYIFNPGRYDPVSGLPLYFDQDGKPDLDDKSNGVEYFAVGDKGSIPNPDDPSGTNPIDILRG